MTGLITAWDPGDTTGVAVWDEAGKFYYKNQVPMERIPECWEYIVEMWGPIGVVIVEDFVLFGHRAKQQAGSRMKASQGIGSLRTLAQMAKAEFVLQPSSIKGTALKQSRIQLPSDHSKTHEWDAYLHGFHYMLKHGIIESPLKKEKRRAQEGS